MAKKLGLSVDSSPTLKAANSATPSSSNTNNSNNNWKVHVGAKRKADNTKKPQEEAKVDFMTPPEKDDQYKGKMGLLFGIFMYVFSSLRYCLSNHLESLNTSKCQMAVAFQLFP